MRKKITFISIIAVLILMVCTSVGCSSSKVISAEYDKDLDISIVTVRCILQCDVEEVSGVPDSYDYGGLFDTDGKYIRIEDVSNKGTYKGKETEDLTKGVQVDITIKFAGNYKGCLLRIWYMDKTTADEFYAIDKTGLTDEQFTQKRVEFIKNNAYIVEWKL